MASILLVTAPKSNSSLQPVATMLQYRLYGGASLPTNLEGLLKVRAYYYIENLGLHPL